jgi:hypothetical protein
MSFLLRDHSIFSNTEASVREKKSFMIMGPDVPKYLQVAPDAGRAIARGRRKVKALPTRRFVSS